MNAMTKTKYAVIGMGKTGVSCAEYLDQLGESFLWFDTRDDVAGIDALQQRFPQVEFFTGELDSAQLQRAASLVVSPGVAIATPAIKAAGEAGCELIGDIELFARAISKPVVAITGSNAKSTVTTLVGEMARACGYKVGVGGNIGLPVLEMLKQDAEIDLYVLELSSFQLETTHSLRPLAATILNISDDHLDRYENLAHYITSKQRIYKNAQTCVVNRDDAATFPAVDGAHMVHFGLTAPNHSDDAGLITSYDGEWFAVGDQQLLKATDTHLAGRHNQANIAACFAIAEACGWDLETCARAVAEFRGLRHRCEFVRELAGVRYYNDSKGTNIGATVAAINGLAQGANVVLIAGGEGKGADFSQLAPVVDRAVKQLILIGRDAELINEACKGRAVMAASLADAVNKARELARAGDVVLLSPACASFDMFKGYDDRGLQFVDCVERLA